MCQADIATLAGPGPALIDSAAVHTFHCQYDGYYVWWSTEAGNIGIYQPGADIWSHPAGAGADFTDWEMDLTGVLSSPPEYTGPLAFDGLNMWVGYDYEAT